MALAFGFIFWGLVFSLVDIQSANGFDYLPDWLGYVLVMLGCARLSSTSGRFHIAGVLSGGLAAIEALALSKSRIGIGIDADLGVLSRIVDLVMIWMLLGGIMAIADKWQRPDLVMRASNRRVAYVVILGSCYLIPLLAGSRNVGPMLGVTLVAGVLVVLVFILQLIHQMKGASHTHGW